MEFVEETRGEYKGFEYAVLFHRDGYRCGYVCIPEGHELYENEDSESLNDIECHGGITYCGNNHHLDSDKWWIGFDCIHLRDGIDIESIEKYFGDEVKNIIGPNYYRIHIIGHIWTLDECIEECKHIIDRICEV